MDRGRTALRLKDAKKALQYYNEALQINAVNVQSLVGRVYTYLQLDELLLAQQDADLLVTIDADNVEVILYYYASLNTATHL